MLISRAIRWVLWCTGACTPFLVFLSPVVGCQPQELLPKLVVEGSVQARGQMHGVGQGWSAGAGLLFEQYSSSQSPAIESEDKALAAPPVRLGVALKPYRHEPSAGEVVAWSAEMAETELERAQDLGRRARLRGLLPTLSVSARHGQALDLDTQQSGATDRVTVATDRDLTLRAALTFDLPQLIFAREELALARQRRSERASVRELTSQIVGLYFERRRLQLSRDAGGASDLSAQLRIVELTALLDAFTDGAFSRMIVERKNIHSAAKSGQAAK